MQRGVETDGRPFSTSKMYPTEWLSRSFPNIARPLDESTFCEALDQFDGAEMRFGK